MNITELKAKLGVKTLRHADLRHADLYGADLRNADLYGANLRYANLSGANLRGATLNWQSHALLGEILQRSASTLEQRSVAGIVSKSTDWCWSNFEREFSATQKAWAKSVLAPLVKEGDGAPDVVTQDA